MNRHVVALSVVVPAYNESQRLAETLPRLLAAIAADGVQSEIIIVDDGSGDSTSEIATEALAGGHGFVIRHPVNRGKGAAFRAGFLAASGRLVLLSDADLATPFSDWRLLQAALDGNSLAAAIGSRHVEGSAIEVPQPTARRFVGACCRAVVRSVTGLPFHDTQCGFKLFDRAAVLPHVSHLRTERFAFDVELLRSLQDAGLSVAEIGVRWSNDERSRVSVVSDSLSMFRDIMRIGIAARRSQGHAPLSVGAIETTPPR